MPDMSTDYPVAAQAGWCSGKPFLWQSGTFNGNIVLRCHAPIQRSDQLLPGIELSEAVDVVWDLLETGVAFYLIPMVRFSICG